MHGYITVTGAFMILPGASGGGLQSSCMLNQQRGTLNISSLHRPYTSCMRLYYIIYIQLNFAVLSAPYQLQGLYMQFTPVLIIQQNGLLNFYPFYYLLVQYYYGLCCLAT